MSTLFKNTAALTAASVGQKVLAFVYFLFLARYLGVESTGAYTLALSITTLFSVLTDVGLQPLLVREVARGGDSWYGLFQNTLTLKFLFTAIAMLCAALFTSLGGYDPVVVSLVLVAIFVMAVDAISLTMYGVLRGLQKLRYESFGLLVGQGITVVVGGLAIILHAPLYAFVLALLCGSFWNALNSTRVAWKHLPHEVFRLRFSITQARAYLLAAFPFALAGIFSKIYASIDSILIEQFHSTEAVGVYAVAYKLAFAFQFLPMAFAAALYPAMSAVLEKDRRDLGKLFEQGFFFLLITGVPIVAGIWAISASLIEQTVGAEFLGAASILSVLVFSVIFLFLDYPIGSLLNATGKQSVKTALFGVGLFVQIVLDLVLIPRYQGMGAAWASVASFFVLFSGGLLVLPRDIAIPWKHLISVSLRTIVAGLGMALGVWALAPTVPLLVEIALGALVYPVLLFGLGVLHPKKLWRDLRALV